MDNSPFDKGVGVEVGVGGGDFDIANYLLLPLHLLSRRPSQVSGLNKSAVEVEEWRREWGELVCTD